MSKTNRPNNGSKKEVNKCQAKSQNGRRCTYNASTKCGSLFCNKHSTQWSTRNDASSGIRRCKSRTHCKSQIGATKAILPVGYDKESCVDCLEHAATNEKNRTRSINIKQTNIMRVDTSKNTKPTTYICPYCPSGITHNIEDMGVRKNGTISNKCKSCFLGQQTRENRRNARDMVERREYSKEYESRPEIKEMRKEYKKSHPELVYEWYTKYRAKELDKNPDEFRKRNAEQQKQWRDKLKADNPEKYYKIMHMYRTDPQNAYTLLQRRADRDGYPLEFDKDYFDTIIREKCYYCGYDNNDDRLMGIDRIDNDVGYTVDNAVPCCKMCNMMKNTLNESTFILMCAHIATYSGIADFGLYPEVFNDIKTSKYAKYVWRAEKKGLKFILDTKTFELIRSEECYLCGKENSDTHINGIDRFDNDEGYTYCNAVSCCGNCNYIKRDINVLSMIDNCSFIAQEHLDRLSVLVKIWTPSNFLEENSNKQRYTKEEKKENTMEKKRIRHIKTMSSKTPDVIKANAAKKKKASSTCNESSGIDNHDIINEIYDIKGLDTAIDDMNARGMTFNEYILEMEKRELDNVATEVSANKTARKNELKRCNSKKSA